MGDNVCEMKRDALLVIVPGFIIIAICIIAAVTNRDWSDAMPWLLFIPTIRLVLEILPSWVAKVLWF